MDQQLLLLIHQGWSSPALDPLFAWLSQYLAFSLPLLLLILALLAQRHGKDGVRLWLLTVAVIIVGDLLGGQLKYLIAQPRPCAALPDLVHVPATFFTIHCSQHLNGMPSNHALNFFACAAFLGFTLRSWRWALVLGAIAGAVSLSRVYLGVHYPSQVFTGAVLGAIYGLLAAQAALKYLAFTQRIQRPRASNHSS